MRLVLASNGQLARTSDAEKQELYASLPEVNATVGRSAPTRICALGNNYDSFFSQYLRLSVRRGEVAATASDFDYSALPAENLKT